MCSAAPDVCVCALLSWVCACVYMLMRVLCFPRRVCVCSAVLGVCMCVYAHVCALLSWGCVCVYESVCALLP